MTSEEMIKVAFMAAYKAGSILLEHFGRLDQIEKKGRIDLVTAADLASEKAIVGTIRQAFPDHAILSEEDGTLKGNSSDQWIIDPLDGTTNYVHNLSIFAVSIAHACDGVVDIGVVFNPANGEIYSARTGAGATLNGRTIRVTKTAQLENSLLVTGFPYNVREQNELLMHRFKRCLLVSQGIRRLGSAALDLCFLACGRFDGFWEENLRPWDTAAGMLIAREAGGTVTDFSGQTYSPQHHEILATNGLIHAELLSLLNQKETR